MSANDLGQMETRQDHREGRSTVSGLELAAGAGGLGLAATRQVEPTGMVLISDVAPEMVAIAHDRLRQNPFVRTAVLDLEDIDQPDESFDVILSRHGLQFALEPSRAEPSRAEPSRGGPRLR